MMFYFARRPIYSCRGLSTIGYRTLTIEDSSSNISSSWLDFLTRWLVATTSIQSVNVGCPWNCYVVGELASCLNYANG